MKQTQTLWLVGTLTHDAMGNPTADFVDARRRVATGATGWQFYMCGGDGTTMDNAPF